MFLMVTSWELWAQAGFWLPEKWRVSQQHLTEGVLSVSARNTCGWGSSLLGLITSAMNFGISPLAGCVFQRLMDIQIEYGHAS